MKISFLDTIYDWKNMSLVDFLNEGNVPSGWLEFFCSKEVTDQLEIISQDLDSVRKDKIIFPPIDKVFRAFYMVPKDDIKCIIIGMDPYHNGSANGLCFSVKTGNKLNPSLRSIYKELKNEGFDPVENGDLSHWASQGVLMLNASLTVEKSIAGSHSSIWYQFTSLLIKYISKSVNRPTRWLLFGNNAQSMMEYINIKNINNIIHCTSHPMPLAAGKSSKRGIPFWGSNVFKNVENVNW